MLATPELILEAGQSQRLAEVLPRWLEEVPLYRQAVPAPESGGPQPQPFPGHGNAGSRQNQSGLSRLRLRTTAFRSLPLITKEDIRCDFPQNFLGHKVGLETLLDQESIELEHTSGTSEERTPLLLPRGWWAKQEELALRLNPLVAGVLDEYPAARRLTIASPVCSGDICFTSVPSRRDRIVGNALYLSLSRYPFLWTETDLARMAAEAVEWQPHFLEVDPVYGVAFARYCERRGLRLPSLRFILCSYEFVSVVHRRILERVFGVPVFNLYGSTETGHLLMEDDRGRMRPSLETAIFELLENRSGGRLACREVGDAHPEENAGGLVDEAASRGHCPGGETPAITGVAELVVTTLTNDFMPLLRYRIGDLVQRFELPYGTRYRVHGRVMDAFLTPQGRRVTTWQIDRLFSDLAGVAHYQLLERPGSQWLLRLVPDGTGPEAVDLTRLQEDLNGLLEPAGGIAIQTTDMLVPESSGKFRLGYPARKLSANGGNRRD